MGTNSLLSCLEKRDLLNQPAVSVDTLVQWGDQFLEAGLVHDALNFYDKAGAREALMRLLETARNEGDAFLLRRLCALLGREPNADEWRAVAEQAERLGKSQFAKKGYLAAGDQARSDAVTEHIPE